MFIIESGSVICRNLPGDQSNNVLTPGDYFGERVLLRSPPAPPPNGGAGATGDAGGDGSGSGSVVGLLPPSSTSPPVPFQPVTRACDVDAVTDVSLIALHREVFDAHLTHLRDLLEFNAGMRLLLCMPLIGAYLPTSSSSRHLLLPACSFGFACLPVAACSSDSLIA